MRWSFSSLIVLSLSQFACAQLTVPKSASSKPKTFSDLATISAKFEPEQAKVGDTVKLHITLTLKPGAYTYALVQPTGQDAKHFGLPPKSTLVEFTGIPADPEGWKDELSEGKIDRIYRQPVTWTFVGKVKANAPGKHDFSWNDVKFQACSSHCLKSRDEEFPKLTLEILPGGTTPVETSKPAETGSAKLVEKRTDLLKFLGLAVFWGLVSLITPCVFPMIPITVSLFLKQGNQTTGGALKFAAVYCLTIMLVLGLSAVFVLQSFKQLSTDAYMNIALAVMMFVFALSLFGWFDIQLPSFMLRAAEGQRRKGGLVGTVFGAVAFSIVSFTCVAPFLGGFAGLAGSNQYATWELVLGGLTFGAAFAAPFFILAMFPTMLKKLPRSGGWLDTVKAVMGFLEVAAAVGFARTAEKTLLSPQVFFTYEVCLAAYVILSIVCGLYLLRMFRLPHDELESRPVHVFQLTVALGFLGLGCYLAPGLMPDGQGGTHRPKGIVFAWVDAFLLPNTKIVPNVENGQIQLPDLDYEVQKISQQLKTWEEGGKKGPAPEKRLIFIDFTGETCKNCILNEKNVFPEEPVKGLLAKYRKIDLYTDTIPTAYYGSDPGYDRRRADGKKNEKFQFETFGDGRLPLYVIVEPKSDGTYTVLGKYDEGAINNVGAFIEFLKKPLGQ